jgi:uncharacterized protein (TIGR00297 family)
LTPALPLAVASATAIAVVAWRLRALSVSGAAAAAVVGSLVMQRGWAWAAYLVSWFAVSVLLSRWARARKQTRTAGMVAKGDRRDAWQVLANGGVFAAAGGLDGLATGGTGWLMVAACGALAAAGADTAGTEVGTAWGRDPWSLRSRGRVPPGTSGAVTGIGLAGTFAGAAVFTMFAVGVGPAPMAAAPALLTGALAGALADTLFGAWWQARRWCDRCHQETEQPIHRCGMATRHLAGLPWLGNDLVNLLCTLVGAATAAAAWFISAPRFP